MYAPRKNMKVLASKIPFVMRYEHKEKPYSEGKAVSVGILVLFCTPSGKLEVKVNSIWTLLLLTSGNSAVTSHLHAS